MGRPTSAIKRLRVEIPLEEALVAEMDLLLFSPTEGRVPYGARTELIESLLRAALARIKTNQLEPAP